MDLPLDRKSSCSSGGLQGQATSVGRGQYHSKEAVNQQQPICHSEQMESWTHSMALDSIEDVTDTQSAVGDEDNIKETSDIELCKL